jgi:hypothetical protein
MKKSIVFFNPNNVSSYVSNNRIIIIISFLIAIICYGYELFNFSLSIDEELESFLKAEDMKFYILLGRWGAYFLKQILTPYSSIPYFPFMISLFCIATSSVLFVNSIKGKMESKIIFSLLFITCPIHSYYLAFNTISPYIGIGMVLAVISYLSAVEALDKKRRIFFLYSVITLTVSLSMYQAIFSLFITLMFFHLLIKKSDDHASTMKETLKRTIHFFLIIVFAVSLYKIVDIAARYIILDSSEFNNTEYLDRFIGWGKIPLKTVFRRLFFSTHNFLSGNAFFGGGYFYSIVLLLPFLLYKCYRRGNRYPDRITIVLLLILMVFAPFSVMYINGSPLPIRTLMALPLLIAIIWLLSHEMLSEPGRKIILIMAIMIFLHNTFTNTRLFYSSYMTWQSDRELANRILDRIYDLDNSNTKDKTKVAFLGMYNRPSNYLLIKSDIFGASFFEWGKGNPNRINNLFKTMGIDNLDVILEKKQLNALKEKAKSFPCWPRKGSVCLVDSIVVVKLSSDKK